MSRPLWSAAAVLLCAACSTGGGAAPEPVDAAPTTTETPAAPTSTTAVTTTSVPLDTRSALRERLEVELGDTALAATVVEQVDDWLLPRIEQMTGGDILGSDLLSYAPSTAAAASIDSLWVFSWGFRIESSTELGPVGLTDPPPPMEALQPGPINEQLARIAAAFVRRHPVPIIAQWEVARVLRELGVTDVISVEPQIAPDGTVTYLSTPDVVTEGVRMAAEAGVEVGHAGVLCFEDHAVGCLLAAGKGGLEADVPTGVTLPSDYDDQPGQLWTRSAADWFPVDILGRAFLLG